jgi:hypothetical protein
MNAWTMTRWIVTNALEGNVVFDPERPQRFRFRAKVHEQTLNVLCDGVGVIQTTAEDPTHLLSGLSIARIDVSDVPRLIGFEFDGCSNGLVCAGTRDENVGILATS